VPLAPGLEKQHRLVKASVRSWLAWSCGDPLSLVSKIRATYVLEKQGSLPRSSSCLYVYSCTAVRADCNCIQVVRVLGAGCMPYYLQGYMSTYVNCGPVDVIQCSRDVDDAP
jgi:hypothetical protein